MTRRIERAKALRLTQQAAEGLSGFDLPVLVLWTRRDPLFPLDHAQRLGALFPDARVAVVDGSRALISLDQSRWLAEHLIHFVSTLGGPDARQLPHP